MLARTGSRFIAVAFVLLSSTAAWAVGPVPPCAGNPEPAFAKLGDPPNVKAWYADELKGWQNPTCIGWSQTSADAVAASAGRFENKGGVDELLARFAKVSAYTNITYLSQHGNGWRPLMKKAVALSSTNERDERPDFAVADLKAGKPLYLLMGGTSVNSIVYRMTVMEQAEDKLTIALENTSTLRVIGIPVLREGAGQFLFTFEKETPEVWKGYVMLRVGSIANSIMRPAVEEYETRATGMFRHFAGLPPQTSD